MDFQAEIPQPSDLKKTLLETRQYNFIHDVIEEVAYTWVSLKVKDSEMN